MESLLNKELMTALKVSLQSVFNAYISFEKTLVLNGHLHLTVDTAKPQTVVVSEILTKTIGSEVLFESKSFVTSVVGLDKTELGSSLHNEETVPEDIKFESHQVKQLSDNIPDSKIDESLQAILEDEIYLQAFMSNSEENNEEHSQTESKPKIESHLRGKKHRKKKEQFLSCSYCGKEYLSKQLLKCHEDSHLDQKNYSCHQCESSFRYKKDLKMHCIRKHSADGFQCDSCSKVFSSNWELSRHKTATCGSQKNFQCTECSATFTFKSSLTRHLRVHAGIKPHICTVCGQSFTDMNTLTRHERVHTGVRPYVCETCGKKFPFKQALKRHERVHSGERPFMCLACGKSFGSTSNLKQHDNRCPVKKEETLVEEGALKFEEVPLKFKCNSCGQSYSTLIGLKQHELMCPANIALFEVYLDPAILS